MDDSTTTSSSSSEMQKAQNQLHPLCKPFPVSPESETIDEVNFDWRSIASSVFNTGDSRPVVLFDGVCNLCNGAVNFSLDHDSKGNFRFASLQSKVGKSLLLSAGKRHDDISSIVLIEPYSKGTNTTATQAYFKSDAVLKIAKKLDDPLYSTIGTVGSYIVPKFIRNILYEFVANNRYRFGEIEYDATYGSCRLDKYEEFEDRFVMDPSS